MGSDSYKCNMNLFKILSFPRLLLNTPECFSVRNSIFSLNLKNVVKLTIVCPRMGFLFGFTLRLYYLDFLHDRTSNRRKSQSIQISRLRWYLTWLDMTAAQEHLGY
jgi:hypothetical protein